MDIDKKREIIEAKPASNNLILKQNTAYKLDIGKKYRLENGYLLYLKLNRIDFGDTVSEKNPWRGVIKELVASITNKFNKTTVEALRFDIPNNFYISCSKTTIHLMEEIDFNSNEVVIIYNYLGC